MKCVDIVLNYKLDNIQSHEMITILQLVKDECVHLLLGLCEPLFSSDRVLYCITPSHVVVVNIRQAAQIG